MDASLPPRATLRVELSQGFASQRQQQEWSLFVHAQGLAAEHCDPRWLRVLAAAFGRRAWMLEARDGERLVGVLPLILVNSLIFGRFLVSLPYLNWAGVIAETPAAAAALVQQAVQLADEHDVRYLELRNEHPVDHAALVVGSSSKVQMRMPLDSSLDAAWKNLKSVVRTQVRKGDKQEFSSRFGQLELLDDFYHVFAHNMRDLGTPVYPRALFGTMLKEFNQEAELCVVYHNNQPAAGAVVIHLANTTEVPSASCLRAFRSTAINSWMYWKMIERAVAKGKQTFDFGRSTLDGGTFQFKKKWGAEPLPVGWQFYRRRGGETDMRPEGGKYAAAIRAWKKLPVPLTRWIGPWIVRGIP